MPIVRECEGCGYKMPAFRRRTRVDGQLLCDGCVESKPGSPGRPVGYHGSRSDGPQRICPQHAGSKDPRRNVRVVPSGPECEICQVAGEPGPVDMFSLGATASAALPDVCATCHTPSGNGGLIHVAGKWTCAEGCPAPTQRTATHETDGVPRFCPFDGSQQTVAGSDGSISCSWCGARYELRLAPSTPAMPQAIEGQEYTDVEGPAADQDGFAPAGSISSPTPPVPGQVVSHYRTEDGALLDEDQYVRHLAIITSSDPWKTAIALREQREQGHS